MVFHSLFKRQLACVGHRKSSILLTFIKGNRNLVTFCSADFILNHNFKNKLTRHNHPKSLFTLCDMLIAWQSARWYLSSYHVYGAQKRGVMKPCSL